MEKIAGEESPRSMAFDWTELTYLQLQAGNTAMYVFALAVVLVFLVLAAQYESWSLPLAVILVVPMCLLCSIVGVVIARLEVNIFTQIGFVVLVGLASKNAILIVEFAKQRQEAGESRRSATLDAARLRLRPILMTSFAFILGVVPLVLASGAGAEMRRALGIAVFSGMVGRDLLRDLPDAGLLLRTRARSSPGHSRGHSGKGRRGRADTGLAHGWLKPVADCWLSAGLSTRSIKFHRPFLGTDWHRTFPYAGLSPAIRGELGSSP